MDWVAHLVHLERRALINESADPRIGSGRNDSTGGGTLAHFNNDNSKANEASSLDSLGSTLYPVAIYSGICLAFFLFFRRRFRRVYAPRTLPCLQTPARPSPELPNGWFDWIKPFFAIKDDYVLNNCSLDGFFFLRFLRVLSIICFVGCCFSWPILLPINGTGGSGLANLETLTIGNIRWSDRFYAHALVAWCFFGFVIFMVCRECVYYVNLRQAYLLSPNYSKRLSSRTVLFTCIPKPYMDEAKLRKLFGDSAKHIWIVRDTGALRALVEDRAETVDRLQQAEVKLIRMANRARQKHLRKHPASSAAPAAPGSANSTTSTEEMSQKDAEKGQPDTRIQFAERQLSMLDSPTSEKPEDPEYTHPYGLDPKLPDVRGSVASLWLPVQSRPHHRPLRNFGRRVDTIRWTRARLKVLNRDIWKLRRKHRGGDGSPLNAAFIEFDTQANAQAAFQILAHHQPLHMSPRYIGLQPGEIIWSTLRIRWWEHIMRRFFMMGVIAAAVIFWSIPSALVGTISNIKELSKTIFFLAWILELPRPIVGIIEGLVPALALSWLMAAVPWMLRGCARVAGVPSHGLVELYVQHAYFAFQVVQVFLVTTITSAASSVVTVLINNPLKVKDLLSENLPKASNFYLSYILVQCLAAGAWRLANIGDLVRHEVVAKSITDPRRRFHRWKRLTPIHWGSEYPRFTNMGVIAISYSCIAPLILVFAGLGMLFVSYVYRYGLIYVYDSGPDTKGLFYPRALMQLMVGLYIAQICLVGLFALKSGFGPMLLMIIFLIFTALVHISLNEAIKPLLDNLPRTLALEKDIGPIAEDERPGDDTAPQTSDNPPGLAADYYNMSDSEDDYPGGTSPNHDLDTDVQLRGIEGSSSLKYIVTNWTKTYFKTALKSTIKATLKPPRAAAPSPAPSSPLTRILTRLKIAITPAASRPATLLLTFLHPEIYQDFRTLAKLVNPQPDNFTLPDDYAHKAYQPPEMWAPAPRLWLPKDEARVSRQEVAHSRGIVGCEDRECWLVENKGGWSANLKRRWGRKGKPGSIAEGDGEKRQTVEGGERTGRGFRIVCEMASSPLWEAEERVIY
ncbi:hypothetical protein VTI74DRAFT_4655 [Chaetomium olivicolor]